MNPLRIALPAVLALLLAAAPAAAAPRSAAETVIQDDAVFLHGDDDAIRTALQQTRELGIERVRLTAGWSVIAPAPDLETVPDGDLGDPAAYPAGNWRNLDRAVRLTVEAGLRPMIDIAFWAPRWATSDPAQQSGRLRTDIDAAQYARFAAAVARRYRGDYVPPPVAAGALAPQPSPDASLLDELLGGLGHRAPVVRELAGATEPLPAVDRFTIWNEPNHPGFMQPQWSREGGRWVPRSPAVYRAMVRAAYPAIKSAAPASTVLIGATSSGGSSTPGQSGVPPLLFLRELACVDARLRPKSGGDCAGYTRLPGDGWSHHPYSLRTLPDVLPRDRDKLPVAATDRLVATLRRLVAMGRIAPAVADVYMTEYGYETNPPDPQAVFSPAQQGGLLAWAEYLATRNPAVKMWAQFQLRDRPGDPAGPAQRPYGDWQSGLINADGTPKPALAAYRTPAFAACRRIRGRRVVEVWGRLRGSDRADGHVEARAAGATASSADDGWRAVPSAVTARLAVASRPARARASAAAEQAPAAGAPVTLFLRWRRGQQVRLHWTGAGIDRTSSALSPARCGARGARPGGRDPQIEP